MKKLVILSTLILATLAAQATTVVRAINNSFDRLTVTNGLTVNYQVSSSAPTVTIEGLQERVDGVKVKYSRGHLIISYLAPSRREVSHGDKELKITLRGPMASIYNLTSASEVKIQGAVGSFKKFEASLAAASSLSIKGKISCEKADIRLSGAAQLNMEGLKSYGNVKITTTAASQVTIGQLNAVEVKASASGASTINLKKIDAANTILLASAASEITAAGKTRLLRSDSAGASTLKIDKLKIEQN